MIELSFDNGSYVSKSSKPNFIIGLLKTPIFAVRIAKLVLDGGRLAKQGKYDVGEWVKSSKRAFDILESVGVKFDISGIENVKNLKEPAVFIGNHMSTLETFVMPLLIQPYRDVTFVIKKELAEMPVFRHIVLTRDPIVVGRQNPREDFKLVMDKGTELLNNGRSIIIYPQTTRTVEFDPKAFNTIGVKLAKKADVPVVPVALKTDAWGNGKIIKDIGKIDTSKTVYFKFFEPMKVEGNGKETHQKIIDLIEKSLSDWQNKNTR